MQKTFYINSAKLNGVNYTKSYLLYDDLKDGGILQLEMSAEPNKNWGSSEDDVPVTKIRLIPAMLLMNVAFLLLSAAN
jgi:putative alpha-1,2-mannosidase